MADKSKNEQYDIVAQAEEVLKLYIRRCFDLNRPVKKKNKKNKLGILSAVSILACIFITLALLYFL